MHKTKYIIEDEKLHAHTVFKDDAALDINNNIRNSNLLEKGKLGIHQKEDLRFVISCPSVFQWNLFKKKFGEIYNDLMNGTELERMSAAKKIHILEPDWVVFDRL